MGPAPAHGGQRLPNNGLGKPSSAFQRPSHQLNSSLAHRLAPFVTSLDDIDSHSHPSFYA